MNNGMRLDVTLVDADGGTWAIFKASAADGTEGAKEAAQISAVADRWAFKLDTRGATAGLTIDLHKLVQPPGSQSPSAQGGVAGAPFAFPAGQLPPGFGPGGALVPGPTPLIR